MWGRGASSTAIVLALLVGACATKTVPPPLPTATKHPEFMFPEVPAALRQAAGSDRLEPGWRYLQNDDFRSAEREFNAALARNPGFYPAHAGAGYLAMARREYDRALSSFAAALKGAGDYVPALIGRGQALLELNRDNEALAAFEAALAADASLTDVRRRIEVLRFRNVQETIEAARTAAAEGRLEDARIAYGRAIGASPGSAFLYRERALVERKNGDRESALADFTRATELDPADAASLIDLGELLDERKDYDGAEAAYRKAAALEPGPDLTARIAASVAKAREARLPPEFHAIAAASQITRGELAALIGVRFEELLQRAPQREVVITDTRDHWAAAWIMPVARAAVIEPFENHTFQPRARVRRGDLAAAVSRLVTLIATGNPALRERIAVRPKIADMSAGHLSYPAAATAVASGVLPLVDGDRFQVARNVSGAEALEAVERLRALAR